MNAIPTISSTPYSYNSRACDVSDAWSKNPTDCNGFVSTLVSKSKTNAGFNKRKAAAIAARQARIAAGIELTNKPEKSNKQVSHKQVSSQVVSVLEEIPEVS